MGRDVIIACDFSTEEELFALVDKLDGYSPYLKIGMESFYMGGADLVRRIKERGFKVFLDLKLHDIPNTVGKAMNVLSKLGADIVNVHAAGTVRMMEKAKENAGDALVIAVTQLTSTDEETMHEELKVQGSMEDVVCAYAMNAKKAGLQGVVCSALEAGKIHELCGDDFLTVTPGIRLEGDSADDQKRVVTPALAKELGSDYIVVGRSITKADDPRAAYERCLEEFVG